MSIKKTTYYKAKEASTEIEPVDPDNPEMAEEGGERDCCICDNPSTTVCAAETGVTSAATLASAQLLAYWFAR